MKRQVLEMFNWNIFKNSCTENSARDIFTLFYTQREMAITKISKNTYF